ncbi:unnamed protein product [Durusdinium trenchii]|uniref:Uncharacterized protein n=1 Tax=Durusdinium trenchii TaxID=1381693 RepID=A0ABP0MUH4_9DINO
MACSGSSACWVRARTCLKQKGRWLGRLQSRALQFSTSSDLEHPHVDMSHLLVKDHPQRPSALAQILDLQVCEALDWDWETLGETFGDCLKFPNRRFYPIEVLSLEYTHFSPCLLR